MKLQLLLQKKQRLHLPLTGCEEGSPDHSRRRRRPRIYSGRRKECVNCTADADHKAAALASCPQMDAVKGLVKLFPHGDTRGNAVRRCHE